MENRRDAESALTERWSTRLLILALLGILFLTLFPFRFTLHPRLAENRSPFLLGGRGKDSSALNAFLNVLLFVPFGFAIADKLRERGRSWLRTMGWSLVLGVVLSYGIEFLQLYAVGRDSGWEDIITNGAGAFFGSILFALCGRAVLSLLSKSEKAAAELLKWPRSVAVIPIYFAAWFAISALMQMQTRLSNWHPDDLLVLGNDAAGESHPSWKGVLFRLQVWNRALPRNAVRKLSAGDAVPSLQTGLLAAYDFSASRPLQDKMNFLPGLFWTSRLVAAGDPPYLSLDGRAWLTSQFAIPNLVNAVRETNQFAVRVVFKPADTNDTDASIVSLSIRHPNLVDMEIGQQNTNLVLRLRNPLSGNRTIFFWLVRNAATANQPLDVLFSYDGATASVYLDGVPSRTYRLGPGTVLARVVHDLRTSALDLYACCYYFIVFFTGGILTGLAARSFYRRRLMSFTFVALSVLIPALLLDLLLVGVSGRPMSWAFVAFSAGLAITGAFWINAEVRPATQLN